MSKITQSRDQKQQDMLKHVKRLLRCAVFTWVTIKPVLIAGISAGLSYFVKCLATNSKDQMFKREPSIA